MYASASLADEDEVLYRMLFQEVDERRVIDAAVEAAKDKCVDTAEGAHGGDGGGGDGADAVIVPGDTGIDANLLEPMVQAVESGEW